MADKTPDNVIDIGLGQRRKVLVAEDEQNIASLIEDWLSEEYEVILAPNGAAAMQKAKWNLPQAILLDVVMPDTGGYEVVCALQGDPKTARIPVIVMTAKNFDDSTVKLIKAEPNVFGFIYKPFKPADLKKQLAQAMSGQRPAPSAAPRKPAQAAPAQPAPSAWPLPSASAPSARTPAAPSPAGPTPAGPPLPPFLRPAPYVPAPAAPPPPPASRSPMPPPPAPLPAQPPRPAAPPPPARPAAPPPPAQPPLVIDHGPPSLQIEPTSALPPAPVEPIAVNPAFPPLGEPPSAPLLSPVPPSPPVEQTPEPSPARHRAPARSARGRVAVHAEADQEAPGRPFLLLSVSLWLAKAMALTALTVSALWTAGELACRWTEKVLDREIFLLPMRPSRAADLPYMVSPSLFWTQGGVQYAFNPWGLRDGEVSLIPPEGTYRVYVLGGTSVFGRGLSLSETVAKRLKKLLPEEKSARYEVINGGLWGFSPAEQWTFYETSGAELKPDLIVWLCEEKRKDTPSSGKLREIAQSGFLSAGVFSGSHLARLLLALPSDEEKPAPPTDFPALIRKADKFARENGARFLYAVLPAGRLDETQEEELPSRGRMSWPPGLASSFGGEGSRSEEVHRLAAEAIYEKIRESGIGPE